jgi:hypothetical protein
MVRNNARTLSGLLTNKLAVSYPKKNHFTRAELLIADRISKLDTVRCMVYRWRFVVLQCRLCCTELGVIACFV